MKHFKDLNVSDYIYCINQSIKIGVCQCKIKYINKTETDIEYILSNDAIIKINVNELEKDNFNDMVCINEELAIYTHKAYNKVFDWFTRNNI